MLTGNMSHWSEICHVDRKNVIEIIMFNCFMGLRCTLRNVKSSQVFIVSSDPEVGQILVSIWYVSAFASDDLWLLSTKTPFV